MLLTQVFILSLITRSKIYLHHILTPCSGQAFYVHCKKSLQGIRERSKIRASLKAQAKKLARNRRAQRRMIDSGPRIPAPETGAKCQQHTPWTICMTPAVARPWVMPHARNSSDTDNKGGKRRMKDDWPWERVQQDRSCSLGGWKRSNSSVVVLVLISGTPTDRSAPHALNSPAAAAARTDGVSVLRPPLGLCLLVTRPRGGRGGAGADRWGRATPPRTPNAGTKARWAPVPFALVRSFCPVGHNRKNFKRKVSVPHWQWIN